MAKNQRVTHSDTTKMTANDPGAHYIKMTFALLTIIGWLDICFANNHFHRTRQRSLIFNYAGIQTNLIAMRQCNKIAVSKKVQSNV